MDSTTLDNLPRRRLAPDDSRCSPAPCRPRAGAESAVGSLSLRGTAVVTADRASRFRWLTRSRRVLLLLGAVWVLNLFDLGYTVLESTRGSFIEMNPIAAPLLTAPTYGLVLYKAGLVLTSSTILLALRRHRLVEMSCWFLLVAYLYVAVRWVVYYEDLLSSLHDPAVNVPRLAG